MVKFAAFGHTEPKSLASFKLFRRKAEPREICKVQNIVLKCPKPNSLIVWFKSKIRFTFGEKLFQ